VSDPAIFVEAEVAGVEFSFTDLVCRFVGMEADIFLAMLARLRAEIADYRRAQNPEPQNLIIDRPWRRDASLGW
jgi:hypothetical protein